MTAEIMRDHVAKLSCETADQLTTRDIHELCDAAEEAILAGGGFGWLSPCLLYTSPSPRDQRGSRMPSSA